MLGCLELTWKIFVQVEMLWSSGDRWEYCHHIQLRGGAKIKSLTLTRLTSWGMGEWAEKFAGILLLPWYSLELVTWFREGTEWACVKENVNVVKFVQNSE